MTPKTPNPDSNESQGGVLLALAARCEAATGTDRELDLEIADYGYRNGALFGVNYDPRLRMERNCWEPTASLDAALTLVPEQFRLGTLLEFDGEKRWCAKLFNRGKPGGLPACGAATPALAIAAASLRARSLSGEGGRA